MENGVENSHIKVWGPFVQVKALRSHEVWPVSKNEVPIFDAFKYENEVALTDKITFYSF